MFLQRSYCFDLSSPWICLLAALKNRPLPSIHFWNSWSLTVYLAPHYCSILGCFREPGGEAESAFIPSGQFFFVETWKIPHLLMRWLSGKKWYVSAQVFGRREKKKIINRAVKSHSSCNYSLFVKCLGFGIIKWLRTSSSNYGRWWRRPPILFGCTASTLRPSICRSVGGSGAGLSFANRFKMKNKNTAKRDRRPGEIIPRLNGASCSCHANGDMVWLNIWTEPIE